MKTLSLILAIVCLCLFAGCLTGCATGSDSSPEVIAHAVSFGGGVVDPVSGMSMSAPRQLPPPQRRTIFTP